MKKIEYRVGCKIKKLIYLGNELTFLNKWGQTIRKADFKCKCGNIFKACIGHVKNGHTQSCGCYKIERIKESNTRLIKKPIKKRGVEYAAWVAMRCRCKCNNINSRGYENYGGRGIKVCERWDSFELFLEDMGKRPSSKHSLDRYPNNDGDYEPTNCRWATRKEQNNNKRNNIWIQYKGQNMTAKDWSIYLGVNYYTFLSMIKRKSFEAAYSLYIGKNSAIAV